MMYFSYDKLWKLLIGGIMEIVEDDIAEDE